MTELTKGVVLNEYKQFEIWLDATDWKLQNIQTIDAAAAAEELSICLQDVLNAKVGRQEAFKAVVNVMEKYPHCGGRRPEPRQVALKILDLGFGIY